MFEECLHSRSAGPDIPSGTMIQRSELSELPKLTLAGCFVPPDLTAILD